MWHSFMPPQSWSLPWNIQPPRTICSLVWGGSFEAGEKPFPEVISYPVPCFVLSHQISCLRGWIREKSEAQSLGAAPFGHFA